MSAPVDSGSGRCAWMMVVKSLSCSTASAMRFIVSTASIGYSPAADSADSMTASAPSKTAVATSDTSARVGTGAVIMLSSICVATTTGLPSAPRQARDPLLHAGHRLERHLHAEIAARDHDRVRRAP